LIRTGVAGARSPQAAVVTADPVARIAELEKENRELRRANAILKSAQALFAAELDRGYQMVCVRGRSYRKDARTHNDCRDSGYGCEEAQGSGQGQAG